VVWHDLSSIVGACGWTPVIGPATRTSHTTWSPGLCPAVARRRLGHSDSLGVPVALGDSDGTRTPGRNRSCTGWSRTSTRASARWPRVDFQHTAARDERVRRNRLGRPAAADRRRTALVLLPPVRRRAAAGSTGSAERRGRAAGYGEAGAGKRHTGRDVRPLSLFVPGQRLSQRRPGMPARFSALRRPGRMVPRTGGNARGGDRGG
jgi:hypothetical protein